MKLLAGLVALLVGAPSVLAAAVPAMPGYAVHPANNGPRSRLLRRSINSNFSSSTFIRRAFQSAAVVDNWLYVDGGDLAYFADNQDIQINIQPMQSTIGIDLSQGWPNDAAPLHIVETPKPAGCPSLNYGALWYNSVAKTLIMGFAGEAQSNQTYPKSLWQFKLDGNGGGTWSDASNLTDDTYKSLTRPAQGMTAYSNTSAFYLGGWTDANTTPETSNMAPNTTAPVQGMVEYNFQNNSWTNHSALAYSNNGIGALGSMTYVPAFGSQGVFITIGGASDGLTAGTSNNTMLGLDDIGVYDPSTQTWYHQKATGIIPEPRYQFCIAGSQASNNNAYDIFLYGGWQGNFGSESTRFDEVFVLTLPAFQWIKVDYAASRPRYGHTCHTVANRQMLFVGGVDPSQRNSTAVFESKDNTGQGFGIFDMSSLVWLPGLLAGTQAYVQNTLIAEIYATSGKWPAHWSDKGLADIMGYKDNTTAADAASPIATGSSLPIGLIVGAAIGGLCAVGLIIIGAWLILRLKHQPPAQSRPRPSAPLELIHDYKWAPPGSSPITEEYAPEKSAINTLGVYPENAYHAGSDRQYSRPQRVVELAHPQVAAVELEGSGERGSMFKGRRGPR